MTKWPDGWGEDKRQPVCPKCLREKCVCSKPTDATLALATFQKSRHHIRCNNVENDTCGHDCYTVNVGSKIMAVVPGIEEKHRLTAEFIANALNAPIIAGFVRNEALRNE